MQTPPIGSSLPESPSLSSQQNSTKELKFSNLRGVQWRIYLGILPSSPSSSIEDFRRVAADSRRRYARLRRCLLVDPHIPKDGNKSPNLIMDDPLSQNPDSMWGRFFRNAELEKMLDQDLSRLYPEHGSYFQSPACQAMLRRILLLWCLRHPEYGYRQGKHELLAPLLYVLYVDIQRLSEVRKKHEDHFTDEFDGTSFPESDVVSNYRFAKNANWDHKADHSLGNTTKIGSLDDLDPETRNIILLNDAYGAEGELGILLSERFLEHDAYCMFDALMNGSHGVVTLAEFFSPAAAESSTSLPPIIEASSALYHLLSMVDSSLHSHLLELEIEPQYFAMRWLRVLFGREFSLDDLLVIWDEVFSSPNGKHYLNAENDIHPNFRILSSPRGAFISAMAVSMILHLRSSLLATENTTKCLQKLLNFPDNIDVKKLIGKAKTLQVLVSSPPEGLPGRNKSVIRGHSLSFGSASPKTPVYSVPESYWEEKWRVLHRTEELQKGTPSNPISSGVLKGSHQGKLSLFRTESDPSPSKNTSGKKERLSVRRSLLDELSQESEPVAHHEEARHDGVLDSGINVPPILTVEVENDYHVDSGNQGIIDKNINCKAEEICVSGENSSVFSASSSPHSMIHNHDSDSEKSSVTSNSCAGDNDEATNSLEGPHLESSDKMPNEESVAASTPTAEPSTDVSEKQETFSKEKKLLPGKFQWFWKFGRGASEGNSDKGGNVDQQKSTLGNASKDISGLSVPDNCGASGRVEVGDKKVMATLRNLGQSMLENIQVIESVFQQERGQPGSLESLSNNILGGKGQATAMAALKELRKISNLISEM